MGSALRATIPPRRAAAILLVATAIVAASMSRGIALASASTIDPPRESAPAAMAPVRPAAPSAVPVAAKTPRPRVLLIGDSVLDQQGSAAAFLLRRSGVQVKAVGLWGSGLLTVDQYDNGRTLRSGWLQEAADLIADFDPEVVGVYLNHNYWPPFPHDAAGKTIEDLWSPEGQQMIRRQARALITILQSRDARVFFIAPIPSGTISDPDPSAWSPIWHGYLPVLRAMHVSIADTAAPVEGANGLRTETRPSCNNTEVRVRPPGDIHLTRFGAGRAGTALARFVATAIHANLRGNAAPGENTAALVPAAGGHGYWLVGCDGSVYNFGSAPRMHAARNAVAGHGGVVAAAATPHRKGLWLIAADGTIAPTGDAPALRFDAQPPAPIVGATAPAGRNGVLAVTATGIVLTAGTAASFGDLSTRDFGGDIAGIASTRSGRGYWLVARDGRVFPFGDAGDFSSPSAPELTAPIVGIAPTADSGGYWLVDSGGSVSAYGNARFLGTAVWNPRPSPYRALFAPPGPTVGITSTGSTGQGYWIFGTTGRVVARGAAGGFGGNSNLALMTQ